MRVVFAIALLAGACSSDASALIPIVDVPAADSDAYPYAAIDTLELSIAREGDPEALALVTAEPGESLDLSGIPFGDGLVVHLSGRAAGTELAYGRTCSVDVLEGGVPLEPHLYFSRLVRWGKGPDLASPRSGGVSGIVVPGSELALFRNEADGQVDVVDPRSSFGGPLATNLEASVALRSAGTLSSFAGGALVVGGVDDSGDGVPIVEHIRPDEVNQGNQVVSITGPRAAEHRSITLEDGSVLVTGGKGQSSQGASFVMSTVAWLYTSLEGELVARELDPGLTTPRAQHSMTRLGNEIGADVLIIGGIDAADQAVTTTELYRPLRDAFETVDSAQLIVPRYAHQAVRLPGGFVLVIGGLAPPVGPGDPVPVRDLELYDPVQGVFSAAGTLPSGAGITDMSVTELPDGRFLLSGGRDIDGVPVNSALIARFDAIDGVVDITPTDSLAVARAGHAAVVLCDGTVLVSGGVDAGSTATERYSPPSTGRR
jgi:hypothetical protein